jgi:ribosomal protein S18 acetylase RimI-like enzyme
VSVALRPAVAADEPFLLRVYASTRAEELAQVPWTDEQREAFAAHQFAAQSAHYAEHYEGMTADVVLIDGLPAGRLLVARWPGEIRIVDVALLPEFRGSGAGTHLLSELAAEAQAAGKPLSIHVERQNRALRLYQRLGFQPVADAGVYVRMQLDPPQGGAQEKIAS